MYQLLIVDDHPDQVESLAKTIPANEMGIDVIYKAYSGIEALEIIRAQSVDIIITDIRMPGMNGIELIKEVKERSVKAKCIILSGYADFEYARQAMQYKATSYLTKPVDSSELILMMNQLISELKKEWEEKSSYQLAMKTRRESLPQLQGEFLNNLLQDQYVPRASFNNELRLLDLPFRIEDSFYLMMIHPLEDMNFNESNLSSTEFLISNIAIEMFSRHFDISICKDVYNYLVFFIKEKKQVKTSFFKQHHHSLRNRNVTMMANNLQKKISMLLKRNITVCISNQPGSFPDDVNPLYQACISTIRQYNGSKDVMTANIEEKIDKTVKGALKKLYQPPLLSHLLETGRWEQALEKLLTIFNELEEKRPLSYEYLQESYFVIVGSFQYISHKSGRQLGDIIGDLNKWVTDGSSLQTLSQLKAWTLEAFELIRLEMYEEANVPRLSVIERIHSFIEQNISGGLSLQTIADYVNLHPSYLSKVYKEETNMSISDYLLTYRMETAATLLQTSEDKIYEIGQQLGYETPHYFIKRFKKYFGMTPQEFRESIINNKNTY